MSLRITGRKTVAVSTAIHPHYRQVLKTYLHSANIRIVDFPYGRDGRTDTSRLACGIDSKDLAAVALQSPNFFGCIEDLQSASHQAHDLGALLITCLTEPLAYGLYKSPGVLETDIACGEGQSLGIPQSFGGPGLGLFACRQKYLRNMPGRLVGESRDENGKRGFVLTLATREQHILREKATSNICTNNSLCALAATMYLSALGATGFKQLARLNYDKTEYLKHELTTAGFPIHFNSPTFNEFVVEFPDGFQTVHDWLLKKNILAGIFLGDYYPELSHHYLLCVTEIHGREEMDNLVKEIKG